MVSEDQARQLLGAQIIGADGENVGTVKDVYLNDRTGELSWVSVATGWFGRTESLLPLDGAKISHDQIRVPFDQPTIKNAPRYQSSVPLSPQDEDELYRHYGIPADAAAARVPADQGANTMPYRKGSGRSREDLTNRSRTDGAQIPAEGQLDPAGEQLPAERTRLRKYVVTEQQTVTVPVSHEVPRLEREAITDQDRDRASVVELAEDEVEIVLHAERPVVSTESVPVERVRLDTARRNRR